MLQGTITSSMVASDLLGGFHSNNIASKCYSMDIYRRLNRSMDTSVQLSGSEASNALRASLLTSQRHPGPVNAHPLGAICVIMHVASAAFDRRVPTSQVLASSVALRCIALHLSDVFSDP
ncbi:hypothetical protein FPOAC2_02429 [Fusarium poae]|jgi:hypothetical protein